MMRKLFYSIALFAFALSSLQAQNLDQILKDHYKSSGQEKMTKIKTMITVGKMTYVTAGMETSLTMYHARPNKLRMEAEVMGSKAIQTYNGTTGWMYAPIAGISSPQEMGSEEIKTVLQQTRFESQLWNYKGKGSTVELDGSSDDGSAHKLKLTQKGGEVMTFLIDKKTHLISGTIMMQATGDSEIEILSTLKDYKAVKGIQVAHYTSTKMNGELMLTLAIESIQFDKDIDPALFEKPIVE